MPTLLQINTALNRGSTGRIAEEIGATATAAGWNCFIAHGARYCNPSHLKAIRVDSLWNERVHYGWHSLLLDRHGLGSTHATQQLIHHIEEEIRPDIIHLHNIHGYYLNYRVLFEYLARTDIPVIWTLHDCWPFTGHCTHFDLIGCDRWKTGCYDCPQRTAYPCSLFVDRSKENYRLKRRLFTSIVDRLILVPVSEWLGGLVRQSFFGDCRVQVIHNGINLTDFCPRETRSIRLKYNLPDKHILLGVATSWDKRKGLHDYYKLSEIIPNDCQLVLVGLASHQIKQLPAKIMGIERTENVVELSELYSAADIVLNLSYEETFGLTTVEGFACGTPAVVYNCTASPELISTKTGIIVDGGDIEQLSVAIRQIISNSKAHYSSACRARTERLYNMDDKFAEYIALYKRLIH